MQVNELKRAIDLSKRLLIEKAKTNILAFTFCTMPNFKPSAFHVAYYNILNDFFCKGLYKKLMVFVPPQHGKSEGSTRRGPAFALGLNPDAKIAIVSYNADKAAKFNREIQRVIDTPEYRAIFPDTNLNGKNVVTTTGYARNSQECEIVNHTGGFKTVGVGGPLTGEPVDLLIMDDIYKGASDAWSPTCRNAVADWYDTVAETRLHNDSRQLIVFTRWHEKDLAGRLLEIDGELSENNPNGWKVCKFPAIDEKGAPLWPERHSLEKLERVKLKNPAVFESLYQQNPTPAKGFLFSAFKEYADKSEYGKKIRSGCYIDVADKGADYLCAIFYDIYESTQRQRNERTNRDESIMFALVTDVIYTQDGAETTRVMVANSANILGTQKIFVESNNGGAEYETALRKKVRATTVSFYQSSNKEARILTNANDVNGLIVFPVGWSQKWPEFYTHVTNFLKIFKANAHDDGVDALVGVYEKELAVWNNKGYENDRRGITVYN